MTHDDHAHSHLDDMEVRVRALESLLTHKGYVDAAAIDALIDTYEVQVGLLMAAYAARHGHCKF